MTTPDSGRAEPSSGTQVPLTPDQQLAEQIVTALADKGLILAEKQDAIRTKLSTGQMTSEDWRLLAIGAIRSAEKPEGAKR